MLVKLLLKYEDYAKFDSATERRSVTESFKRSVDHHSEKDSSNGRILVSRYAEQQVGAAMNMFSLQKWAKYVGVSVIEPFVQNSMETLTLWMHVSYCLVSDLERIFKK